jgi:hypothetical protein
MAEDSEKLKKTYPYHRRWVRYKVRLRILVAAQEDYDTWTENLSRGGVCFEIPRRIEDGQVVTMRISLRVKPPGQPVRCQCRVVWSEPSAEGFRHGGQFESFEEADLDRLNDYLGKF